MVTLILLAAITPVSAKDPPALKLRHGYDTEFRSDTTFIENALIGKKVEINPAPKSGFWTFQKGVKVEKLYCSPKGRVIVAITEKRC